MTKKNRRNTVIAAAIAMVGGGIWIARPLAASLICDQAYSRAALQNLPWVMGVPSSVCRGTQCSKESLENDSRRAKELRDWAQSLPDTCTRYAYAGWADHVEYRVRLAKKEAERQRMIGKINLPKPPN